ncbi:MAG: alcohol dehydrogenase catalytic domain-containing protein [Solirubrobacterales bacterium]|nr:alcohol dehydrogenase catalytic domain-containing protein [Solirubrobacterales bacterium]MBV9166297.1 alcohol dehydrogenase catalytic domain-containing protein [Solirubrobacterales bacterium]MBV9534102.1 alcohol dehydrogenase catalytic domain-containing protein [Solirubrobacterales bacterium]
MKAAVLHAPEDLRVEEVQEPEGEVILEVLAATTCGTDVKMWRHGHRALAPYPCLFGHETAGRRLDTGERVLVSDSVACGSCAPCRAGRAQICRSPTWVLGGFAQRIGAPAAALHPIPEGLPPAAAAMAEPLAAVLHAIARGSGATDVGVLGGGSIGLMLAGLLAREGRSVLVADRHPERREQATALGARAAPRLAKHELVFEAVGRPEAWRQAICAAGPGAVVVLVGGCPGGTEVSFPSGPIHYDELELRGTFHHAPAEVDQALRVLAGGEFPWSLLAGEAIGLERLGDALAASGRGPAHKWVVDPRL